MADDTSGADAQGRPVARNVTVDTVVAACLALLGVVVMVEARRLGAEWSSDGPGSGYFPFYIGLILAVCGAAILVQSLRARRTDRQVFVDSVQLERVLSVLLPAALYVGAIMLIGLYVASALFIALFMIVLGKYPWGKSLLIGTLVNVLFFAMFEIWFKVPLYKGALDPLRLLGY
ncbi:MAG TPA: tripartite tricarboxylate transporter TctB family protein [Rubrivivax sp.]|nr:tripartite tricarboxylate transporter TctB family protein [Rubrivivax sp.]